MPELPEVETSCRGIEPHAKGEKIMSVCVRQPKLRWPVDPNLSELVANQKIEGVKRRAKYLQLQTEKGDLLIHLGMSGSLKIVTDQAVTKHDHLDILLSNGKIIRFNDPRRFGCVLFNQQGRQHPLLINLGPEPLSDDFNAAYLQQKAKTRKGAIKNFIMNAQIVVGVGNIYAAESLFMSGIHPNRAANRVSFKRLTELVSMIKMVLEKAILAGGSSLKDFTGSDGKPGYFQQELLVYGRQNLPCVQCETSLKNLIIGQRASVYCPHCQK